MLVYVTWALCHLLLPDFRPAPPHLPASRPAPPSRPGPRRPSNSSSRLASNWAPTATSCWWAPPSCSTRSRRRCRTRWRLRARPRAVLAACPASDSWPARRAPSSAGELCWCLPRLRAKSSFCLGTRLPSTRPLHKEVLNRASAPEAAPAGGDLAAARSLQGLPCLPHHW